MKKLFLAVILASSATCVMAKEPFHFGIGMCEYAYSGSGDAVMYGIKNAYAMPEDVYKKQDEFCGSKENIDKAEQELKKWKSLPDVHPQYEAQPKDADFNRGLDIYNACVAGAQVDAGTLSKILGKYRGNHADINTIRKAFNYGNVVARSERDCTNYVMGR